MAVKTCRDWDYTELAADYDKRPDYARGAVDRLLTTAWKPGARACDVGAGTGRLTAPVARHGFRVAAVEPNPAMMRFGLRRTSAIAGVHWIRSVGEATGLRSGIFDLVCYGSSWNVVDREAALVETARLLKPDGWWACLYNHRDLDDPLQKRIEAWIHRQIPGYDYGARRQDPTSGMAGAFAEIQSHEEAFVAEIAPREFMQAWKSHATLRRQAGARFDAVLEGIRRIVRRSPGPIRVPYLTRLWMARLGDLRLSGPVRTVDSVDIVDQVDLVDRLDRLS